MAWADVADAVGNDGIDVTAIGMNALNAQRQNKKEAGCGILISSPFDIAGLTPIIECYIGEEGK